MNSHSTDLPPPLFARLSAERARTYSLVLSALGITHQVNLRRSGWSVSVPLVQRAQAIEAITLYLKENPSRGSSEQPLMSMGLKTASAWYVAAILALIHVLIALSPEKGPFVNTFGADADRICSGEFYRCVTALLLHVDSGHLAGNIAGLILFGTAVASLCGWGVGWAMILATGAFGNLLTALWYRYDHLAIGSSTAVFGAVGICVALNLRLGMLKRARQHQHSWRRWMPLAGGLALLGLLGTSPQADLMAHASGFGIGLLLGWVGSLKPDRLPHLAPVWVQWVSATAAFLIVAACWLLGLAQASP